MRFPRTIRRDASDIQAFATAAEAGEWAVSGAFAFSEREPSMLIGKAHQAFRTGFLGTASFGWSSLVEVAEIATRDYEGVVEALAQHLIDHYHAPDRAAARAFAEEECRFAQSLCDRPVGTLVAVERSFGPQGIVERFRTMEPTRDGEELPAT
jgi:hypothetical protein